jgi:tRNA1Val (adenine37-N6)-methyltransferase
MMPNNYFNFKQFTINQEKSAFKVGTDGVLLGACAELNSVSSILDIGSGTGLISLMLAQRCDAMITAIEPDYESYLQCSDNMSHCPWKERLKVINTDLQSFAPQHPEFDLIVTNPPFFNDSLKSPDPRKSAARHNDSLTSGEILESVRKFMKEDGNLQLILPYAEGNIFIAEANMYGLYCNSILKIKSVPTAEIRRLILKFSRVLKKPSESFLTIEHGKRHEFTEEYINLTKDFYLKF